MAATAATSVGFAATTTTVRCATTSTATMGSASAIATARLAATAAMGCSAAATRLTATAIIAGGCGLRGSLPGGRGVGIAAATTIDRVAAATRVRPANVGASADGWAAAVAGVGCVAAAAAVAAAAVVVEAMAAPAVAVSVAGPGAHAEEDAVIEVARPVEAVGRAGVGGVVVVAPLADGRLPATEADADLDLGLRGGGRSKRDGGEEDREHRCRGE